MNSLKFPSHTRFFLRLILVQLSVFTALRLAFFFVFRETSLPYTGGELAHALWIGFRFDLRMALFIVLPLMVLGWFPFLNWRKALGEKIWSIYLVTVMGAAGLIYGLDFGYFSYLNNRVNATVLKFLENPVISFTMLWESYPIIPALLGFAAILAAYYVVIKVFVFKTLHHEPAPGVLDLVLPPRRTYAVARYGVLALGFAFGLWGTLGQYPLRWSEAYFVTNSFISALALNPVLYFVDTLENREKEFDEEALRKHYDAVADFLQIDEPDSTTLNFGRARQATPNPQVAAAVRPPNIVYIIMESFAAYKTGTFGHPMNPTPYFDQLASQGTLFTRFYVPSEGTARSVFGLLTGIPDVGKNRTSSRNPLIVNQHTLVNAFKGYEKFYFIGGSANWGNIRGVISNNIPGIHLVEEGQFKSARTDVWGISDLNLFEEANDKLKETSQPFIAFIQTAGFHRPYTIPQDRRDFKELTLSEDEVKSGGFVSEKEYNSLRFADYSLGHFIELAKKSPYFANTIFIIHGDHGLPDYQAKHVSEADRAHLLTRFQVPLLFYAPELMPEPKKISKIASSLDVLPSAAGLAGHSYFNTTLGRNLFDPRYDKDQFAFTYVYYQSPPQIGLISERFYTYGTPEKMRGLFLLDSPGTPVTEDVSSQYKDIAKKMEDLTFGLYESSKYLLYHNPHLEITSPASTIGGGKSRNRADVK